MFFFFIHGHTSGNFFFSYYIRKCVRLYIFFSFYAKNLLRFYCQRRFFYFYAFFFRFRCITLLLKALYIAGDNSGASSSGTIGDFFAFITSCICSFVGFCPLLIVNVLIIIEPPLRFRCQPS